MIRVYDQEKLCSIHRRGDGFRVGFALAPVTLAGHNFDHLYVRRPRRWLAVIVLAYILVATLYAFNTPLWQAPDEPAHYNYIAHIAETGTLPVLEAGDDDQAQLELLLERAFAPKLPIEALQYESYQPPLYYLSAVPVDSVE